ncbi:hypothetical protein ABE33_15705 [Bacillus safensis]|uniref:Uncharacterized protein n=1 Tax=Bacillus safensis TaxID=561879 RepID=A0A5C0WIR0_BACIA|nr:hypothetical protein [Bacillus safensis]MBG9823601.1 hypothetical protein [Bacillus safensis]MBG9833514.1 hypothetical protein [Bacillus safensis]MBG9862469.1 hypothetical protein [Bacillus safensis]MBG9898396.1 hypothetical protein [Bacillus safensis]
MIFNIKFSSRSIRAAIFFVKELRSLYDRIHFHSRSGHLFDDERVEEKDKRISYDLLDGARKFYRPIWSYMGKTT